MGDPADREAVRLADAYRRRTGEQAAVPARLGSPGDLLIIQERERRTIEALRPWFPEGLGTLRVLDFGCGGGAGLLELLGLGAARERIVGVDLLGHRLVRAHHMLPDVALLRANGGALPLRDGAFDVALQYTAFSSILDDTLRRRVAAELGRVLRPGGVMLSYDLRINNPRNPDVRRVSRSELGGLFPGWRIESRTLTLAPPVARRLAGVSRLAAEVAGTLPFLRTHLFATLVKPV